MQASRRRVAKSALTALRLNASVLLPRSQILRTKDAAQTDAILTQDGTAQR